jgi:hypothetical protein
MYILDIYVGARAVVYQESTVEAVASYLRSWENVMRNLASAFILLFVVSIPASTQSARHPFTFDDAAILHKAVAVAASPDGKSVLFRIAL